MFKKNREELYSLSNQFIEIFIADIFSKNKVNMDEIREKVSDEQREKLKSTVNQLKEQVEEFLQSQNTKKITEKETKEEPSSPLREKLKKTKTDNEDKEK
ncbi:hypothetical protein M2M59_12105 [Rummeliibacillus sp. G93]|uniref:hypothetical protein n=1 Tax=Rummeliibacillus TaxID=648802 RepID=UPI00116D22A3|nr:MULTISPECIES: hypothetical protein [Rummeliibacillus]MBB5171016.1 DNA-binding IscR family transcriptional regulator [Rummeliibacillus stabekisii]UQW96701.1 hypothetical protein M2M59_12105 [Rummeliibacillus sp. G93]GEL05329.1 hypothetical protein RST01_19560 [Rummeliibacillus stabekisii]